MKAIEFLHATFDPNKTYLVRPRAKMADGYQISIQGGTFFHHCSPRSEYAAPPVDEYSTLELGYPSKLDSIINEYAEIENTTGTVFNYVPLSVVELLVEKHGGIIW